MYGIGLIHFLPIMIFIIYSRLYGMVDAAWHNAFIVAGLCVPFVVAIQFHKKMVFDRIVLGVNLFLLMGAIAFLGKFYLLVYCGDAYKGAALFMCVALVGIVTTLYTDTGFVGVDMAGKAHLKRKYSYALLAINSFCIIWALVTHRYDRLISIVVPFIALRTSYEGFVKKLEQIK